MQGTNAKKKHFPVKRLILYTPTKEQLDDPRNLFAIVWKIKQLLVDAGYSESSIRHYTSEGLNVILRKHYEAGSEVYSERLTNDLVAAKRMDYENGVTSRQSFQNLRKGAVFISSFVNTGQIDLSPLPSINTRILCSSYEVTLDSFCSLMLKEHRLKLSSVHTIRSAIRNFLLGLESIGVFSFEKLDQAVVNHCITITANRYPRGAGGLLFAMRLFLGYLYETDVIKTDLSSSLPQTFAVKKTFHEPFSAAEIQMLLSVPDRSTCIGSRNYAIMLLASKNGLRACDIVCLKREDIDWRRKQIHIIQQKTGVSFPEMIIPKFFQQSPDSTGFVERLRNFVFFGIRFPLFTAGRSVFVSSGIDRTHPGSYPLQHLHFSNSR